MTGPTSLFLALLLAVSAGHKLAQNERLAPVAARLAGAPPPFGPALLLTAMAAEALAALALLAGPYPLGGAIAAGLWSTYAIMLWRRRGETLDCGCDFVRRETPIGARSIARPVLLAALATATALLPAAPWAADTPFAALALLALWFAGSELSALPPLVSRAQRNHP